MRAPSSPVIIEERVNVYHHKYTSFYTNLPYGDDIGEGVGEGGHPPTKDFGRRHVKKIGMLGKRSCNF